MKKAERVIMECRSLRQEEWRVKGSATGRGPPLLSLHQEGLDDRGLEIILISSPGCLRTCQNGPAMVLGPSGSGHGGLTATGSTRFSTPCSLASP